MSDWSQDDKYFATPTTNRFIGECTSVGYRLTDTEVAKHHLTDSYLFFMVKTPRPVFPLSEDKLFNRSHFNNPDQVPLRIMSSCLTGLLGDAMCDCHDDFIHHLKTIQECGEGVFVYVPQEGQSRGLMAKLMDHRLQHGFDLKGKPIQPMTFPEACDHLFPNAAFDIRSYDFVRDCFRTLGFDALGFRWLGGEEREASFEKQTRLIFHNSIK